MTRNRIWIAPVAMVLGLGQALAQQGDLPDPDAQAVIDYLQAQSYTESWPLWPGKDKLYQGTEPHGMLLTTYVNSIARDALEKGVPGGEMPSGSIIVKENYKPSETLAAVTVMYKNEGYNSEHNDWFWLKYSAGGDVQASGKVESCQACHQAGVQDYLMTPLPQ